MRVSRFMPNYATNPLSSYNTFVCHLGDWKSPLKNYLTHPQFRQVFDFVKHAYQETTWFPPKNLIFNAFQQTPFEKLKVVMVGMEPFAKFNEATGLSFSVPKTMKCPATTENIYRALENDTKLNFKAPVPLHGNLDSWAKQGILMLNNWLTVRENESFSHSKSGWAKFTKAILDSINKEKEGVVFLCWGKPAQKVCKMIDRKKHYVLSYSKHDWLSISEQLDIP